MTLKMKYQIESELLNKNESDLDPNIIQGLKGTLDTYNPIVKIFVLLEIYLKHTMV